LVDSQIDRCGGMGSATNLYCSGILSTHFLGCRQEGHLSTRSCKFYKFCRQDVGQTVGYGIAIASGFVRQLLKNKLKTMP
jgi:hypothetical protein